MTRAGFIAGLVVLAVAGVGSWASRRPAAAEAPAANSDPWSRDAMHVLGTVYLPDGIALHAVHVPGYPLSQVCVVMTGPQGGALRCEDDLGPATAAMEP